MQTVVNILQVIFAVVLIVVVLLQAKGAGLGGIMGSDSTFFRTRRGLEKVLFRFTIVWGILFIIISLISARVATF